MSTVRDQDTDVFGGHYSACPLKLTTKEPHTQGGLHIDALCTNTHPGNISDLNGQDRTRRGTSRARCKLTGPPCLGHDPPSSFYLDAV